MKNVTRTFKRFISKNFGRKLSKDVLRAYWKIYREQGRQGLLMQKDSQDDHEYFNAQENVLVLPPSMPKSHAEKIKSYSDTRESGGNIKIELKENFKYFQSSMIEAVNVKDAINCMRSVVGV